MSLRAHIAGLVLLSAMALLCAAPAGAAGARVAVRVLDATCFGPCTAEGERRPYAGPGRVIVKRTRGGRRVAREGLEDGLARAVLAPGSYRVRVKIADPCWGEDAKRVSIKAGERERVRLVVANDCIR